jgi:uncharacterized membrane protein SirB2
MTNMYLILKNFHMMLATLTISGFLLRGYWMMSGSGLRQNRAAKVLPHIIDTLFLATGIWLVVVLKLAPLQHPWLLAKFTGLLAYIGLGMVAMRFGRTPQIKMVAFIAAIAAFAYIVGVALTKNPISWIAYS